MSTITQIKLTNCGPIEHLTIPFHVGRINVLQGRNGTGKSTALEAIEHAMTGKGDTSIRDGAETGQAEAFGITLKLSGRTRRSGSLEVESIEGKFNVSSLIDPGIAEGKAADARRIKAFAMIQKVLPSADLFYDLVGGREQLEKLVRPASLRSDDLVVMAERIKADLQDAAKKEEDQAENFEGRALGSKEAARGVDITGETDAAKLQAALNAAISHEAQIKAEQAAAVKGARAARLAQDQLADAEAAYNGPSVAEATVTENAARDSATLCERDVHDLEAKLLAARQKFDLARQHVSSCINARKTAEQHETAMAQWRAQVAAAVPVEPAPELLTAAAERVAACHTACERGAEIRKAKEHLAAAEQHVAAAGSHRKRAAQLRDAAKGTDDVLSEIVAKSGSKLRVEHGRLVLDTPRRGKTFFHELSPGERARIAVDIGIDAMPTNRTGAIVVSQEVWESLDPQNRSELAEHIAQRNVGILTAEAGEQDQVTPEVFEPEHAAVA